MNIRLPLLLVLLAGRVLFAQGDSLKFSLNQAVEYAMQNNKTLKNVRDEISVASQQIKEARAKGLPQVSGTVDYMTNFNYEFEFAMGGTSTTPQIDFTQLDNGDLQVLSLLDQMFSSDPSTITMEDQANATVQVSQLIFSGQYWVGMQMAKLGESMQQTSLTISELDVKEQVMNSYYLVLITEKLLDVLDGNIQNLDEIYTHTNNMYRVGVAEQTDVDQIEINLSQLKNSKVEMERSAELNYNMFRLLLGIEADEKVELTDDLDQLMDALEKSILATGDFVLDKNPGFQMLDLQEELGEKQVGLQRWAYAPTLVGFYSYKEKLMTTSFDLSPNHAAGLTLSIPIFVGGEKQAQLNQKKIQLDQAKRNKELIEEQLMIQNKQMTFDLNNAFDNYKTQKRNIEVANRVFESFQNKYKQGMVSSLELTQANSNYLQAESNYISSAMKLLQAKLAMDKLYNTL